MALHYPVVRHLLACERIDRSNDSRHYSLINVVHAIRPHPGASYPRIHPEIQLFAVMTDGRGDLPFIIELVALQWDEEELMYQSAEIRMNLGDNPLTIHAWPIRLRNIPFVRPGLYEFRLRCDGKIISQEPILLRESRLATKSSPIAIMKFRSCFWTRRNSIVP